MPVISVYHHGCTLGTPPMKNDHKRALRSEVGGWSKSSTRRNTAFLYSVDEKQLTGEGFGLTLTVKDCPPTSQQWAAARTAWVHRLRRDGLIRLHWVTEWQKRGVPHLHCACWFKTRVGASRAIQHWTEVTAKWGSGPRGQAAVGIHDAVGWFQYLSKHASRGLSHYQRSPENIPPQWRYKTGRMWGKVGEWPVGKPHRFEVNQDAFWQFRRRVRSWRISDARQELRHAHAPQDKRKARRRLQSARRMLSCNERFLSEVRGCSEWIESDQQLLLMTWLAAAGYEIVH